MIAGLWVGGGHSATLQDMKLGQRILALLLLASFAESCAAGRVMRSDGTCAVPADAAVVELETGDGGMPIVFGEINERGLFAFVLDNGAGGTTFNAATRTANRFCRRGSWRSRRLR